MKNCSCSAKNTKSNITEKDINLLIKYNNMINNNEISQELIYDYLGIIIELNSNTIYGIGRGYSIQTGESVFTLYSINGQILLGGSIYSAIEYIKQTEYFKIKKIMN